MQTKQKKCLFRVQVEELLALRASVARLYEDSCAALEELLRERYTLRDSVFNTYRSVLRLCKSARFNPCLSLEGIGCDEHALGLPVLKKDRYDCSDC